MYNPKLIVSNQKEESIRLQRVSYMPHLWAYNIIQSAILKFKRLYKWKMLRLTKEFLLIISWSDVLAHLSDLNNIQSSNGYFHLILQL